MATPFALPGLDQENEALKAQLLYADALRNKSLNTDGQMVSGIYVPKSPWANFTEAFGGSALRSYQETERTKKDQARAAEEQAWLAQMPGATEQTDILNDQQAADLMGNDVHPASRTVTKSPEQMIGEQQRWVQGAPPSSQFGAAARGHLLTQAMSAPYKAIEREDAQAARLQEAKEKAADRLAQIQLAEQERRITREEADMRARETKREFMFLAKTLGGAAKGVAAAPVAGNEFGGPATAVGVDPATKNPIYRHTKSGKLIHYVDGVPTEYNSVIAPKPDAATVKNVHESNLGMQGIDAAIPLVKAQPDAFGPLNAIPGMEIITQYTKPEGVAAKAVVANIGSLKVHDRSGAAVTISEFPRLAPFIPKASDRADVVVTKLGLLKDEYARMQAEWSGQSAAPTAPKYRLKPGADPKLKSSYEVY